MNKAYDYLVVGAGLFGAVFAQKMRIVINPSCRVLADFIQRLPETFDTEGEVIYTGRNILKRYQIEGVDLVVKSFKIPILANRIAYTFLRKSKACRSYEYAFEILRRGCDTPAPIAYIEEYKLGLLYRSYYVSVYDAMATTVRPYVGGDMADPDNLFKSLACYTAKLHQAGILHIDYSPGNILFAKNSDGSYRFSVIDINRLCFKKPTLNECFRNFDRLCLSVPASTRLAEEYALCRSLDVAETVNAINNYADLFFLKRTFTQASKKIKKEQGWLTLLFGPLQKYSCIRLLRRLFAVNRQSGWLFEKEVALYDMYLKENDPRRVLMRKNHYEESPIATNRL